MPQVIETRPIVQQHNQYVGWPTVAAAPDGVLHAVFSGDRDSHICPFGNSCLTSSSDGGISWSEPRVINSTPLDDRDTGLCIQPDGTMILSWFSSHYYRAYEVMWRGYSNPKDKYSKLMKPWREWADAIKKITPHDAGYWAPYLLRATPQAIEKWTNAWTEMGIEEDVKYDPRFPANTRRLGFWTRRSTDGGKTWDDATPSPVMAPHGPNILPDGQLVYVGQAANWYRNLGVATSPDNGLSWNVSASINAKIKQHDGTFAELVEPHVVAAPSGKLVALARYEANIRGEERFLWQFDSDDQGGTWSDPRPTNLNGYPPHLLRTSDGRLLASFSVRHDPLGFRFCFSNDEGKSWDVANQLHIKAEFNDLGYPATAEVSPGQFVSVYYQRYSQNHKPFLMMTRWKG